MDGVSGAGYGATGPANTAGSAAANTQSSAAYSLAARVAIARGDTFNPAPAKIINPQIDAAILAKAAIEDELRKRGGGGGGGAIKSYNPMLWIPYSFKLMAQSIDQTRAMFAQAFLQIANFIPNTLAKFTSATNNFFANLGGRLTNPITNLFGQMQRQANNLLQATLRAPLNMAVALGSNVSHLANMIANALTQGLRKFIFGKDDKDEELDARKRNEIDDEFDFAALDRLGDFMPTQETDAGSATQSIKGHIDNLANQLTRWASSFGRK